MIEIAVPVHRENFIRESAGSYPARRHGVLVAVCLSLVAGCGAVLVSMALVTHAHAQQPAGQMQLAPADEIRADPKIDGRAGAAEEKPATAGIAAPSTGESPAPAHRPGLLDAVRNWFETATPTITPNFQDAQDTLSTLGERARSASEAAIRATQESAEKLSNISVGGSVTGHELCAVAPNGAPDCEAAAIRLCQSKGLKGGKSADFVSAEKCSAQALLSGRKDANSCKTETFVTRAACQ